MATFFFTEKNFEGNFDVSRWNFDAVFHAPLTTTVTEALNNSLPDRLFLEIECNVGADFSSHPPCSFKVGFNDCFGEGVDQVWFVPFDDFAGYFGLKDYDAEEYAIIASELRRLADKFDEKANSR